MCALKGRLSVEEERIREVGLSTLYLPLQRRPKISVEQLAHRPCGNILQFDLFTPLPVGLVVNVADSTKR